MASAVAASAGAWNVFLLLEGVYGSAAATVGFITLGGDYCFFGAAVAHSNVCSFWSAAAQEGPITSEGFLWCLVADCSFCSLLVFTDAVCWPSVIAGCSFPLFSGKFLSGILEDCWRVFSSRDSVSVLHGHVLGLRIEQAKVAVTFASGPLVQFVGWQPQSAACTMFGMLALVFLFSVIGLATTTLSKGPSLRQLQPRHHGWTWRRTRKRQPRLTVLTSFLSPSRCLFQKHPDFLFAKVEEGREERKVREDGGDTVLLVRGLMGNTMVVRCGSGWTARDLSASLRRRTSVPVHLLYLVVEGRVIDADVLVTSLGRDCVVSMRGRVLGGSRNVSPIPGEWTCPGCMRS